ncbi:MAG: hypothetical protein DRN33_06250 [Thermoplasmata archaeon]|nr:MAG: hypothetical protein DRN33_06250 [Thermoplasmata archaeon]
MKSPKVKYTIPYKYNGHKSGGGEMPPMPQGAPPLPAALGGKGGKLLVPTTSNICPFAVRK